MSLTQRYRASHARASTPATCSVTLSARATRAKLLAAPLLFAARVEIHDIFFPTGKLAKSSCSPPAASRTGCRGRARGYITNNVIAMTHARLTRSPHGLWFSHTPHSLLLNIFSDTIAPLCPAPKKSVQQQRGRGVYIIISNHTC